MRTGEMSKRLGRSPGTIRWWCDRYGHHLSETARGKKPGARRIFDDLDALKLATINDLSNQGLPTEDIDKALESKAFVDSIPDLPTADEEQARRQVSLVPVDQLRASQVQIRTLEVELDRLRSVSDRDRAKIESLQYELGKAHAELEVIKKSRKRGLFGR